MSRLIAIFAFAVFVFSVSSIALPDNNAHKSLGSGNSKVKSQADAIADAKRKSASNARSESRDASVARSGAKAKDNGLANTAAKADGASSANALAKANGKGKQQKQPRTVEPHGHGHLAAD